MLKLSKFILVLQYLLTQDLFYCFVYLLVPFLALVTTMVTMVDHGNPNHRSNDRGNDRSNHRGYYNRYYNVNA